MSSIVLSVIIPAYKEPYLAKTIDSFLQASELGDQVEILPILDGPWLEEKLKIDPRVKVVQLDHNQGMREAINAGIRVSKGRYIMKIDAHCTFGQGFDRIMVESGRKDRLMIPRRYSLNELTWKRDVSKRARDYHYFEYPKESIYGRGLTVLDWFKDNTKEIDNTMTFQGSCWMANKEYFLKHIGFLDTSKYGTFVGEQHEIGLKYWLGGGQVKVNKKTWYAHLSKREHHYEKGYERDYKLAQNTAEKHTWVANHWMNNQEVGMVHPFSWLIKKFQPPGWEKYD